MSYNYHDSAIAPMPKLIFHLGFPKTGSTTIQELLKINRDELFRRGILISPRDEFSRFLRRSAIRWARAGGLFYWLIVNLSLRMFASKIKSAKFESLIVSDENIIGVESARLFSSVCHVDYGLVVRSLENLLGSSFDCHYIVYTRNSEKWRTSAYNQTIKKGKHVHSYSDWCIRNSDLNAPNRIITRLYNILGDRLLVVKMEDELSTGNPLGSVLLRIAGLESSQISELKKARIRNVSLPEGALAFIRILGESGCHGRRLSKIARLVKENSHLFQANAQP
jgi:hypothetical protein